MRQPAPSVPLGALGATDALVSLVGTAEERARALRLLGAGQPAGAGPAAGAVPAAGAREVLPGDQPADVRR
ncbi:hypothetical protein [Frankia sp. CiP1_Cm_nod2]|uniref:hypothetical protein n=1 Tax=Frankia sp. CiP1_Cm_nod2 TaxID=2897161 RepID=UPI00202563B9